MGYSLSVREDRQEAKGKTWWQKLKQKPQGNAA